MHREGYVVEFSGSEGSGWVGNFQPGLASLFAVVAHPNGKHIVVVAGGQAYVVEPNSKQLVGQFGAAIQHLIELPQRQGLLVSNGLWFELHGAQGLTWRSKRVSWDGVRNIQVQGGVVGGEGWCFDESWHAFSIQMESGCASGGGYHGTEP